MRDQILSRRTEIIQLRRRLDQVESRLSQIHSVRNVSTDRFKQVRWCITSLPQAGSYPATDSGATVFPIRFIDPHFDPQPGTQTFEYTERSSAAAAVAFSRTYVPVGTKRLAVWQRGLGEESDGEWWLIPDPDESAKGVPFLNSSGEEAPAFAPMYNFGDGIIVESGTADVECGRPDTRFDIHWLINGETPIPNEDTGRGFWRFEESGPVQVDPSLEGQISPGNELGVVPGEWFIGANRPGFIALGGTRWIGDILVVDCRQRSVTTLFGKAYVDISQAEGKNYVEQNAAGTTTVDFEIWRRRANGQRVVAGWDKITATLFFLNKQERVHHGTWGRVDWNCEHWEGDFACDKPDTDESMPAGGAGQDTQFIFEGPDNSGSTEQLIQMGIIQ